MLLLFALAFSATVFAPTMALSPLPRFNQLFVERFPVSLGGRKSDAGAS
jgi:hypothetical protein